jgi:hypothetical protein
MAYTKVKYLVERTVASGLITACFRCRTRSCAVVFMVPTNAPGVKLICRTSYEMSASVMGSPFDYPISSMAEYDLGGWKVPDLTDPGELSFHMLRK